MHYVNHVYPTRAGLAALLGAGDDGPIVMVNLLKFREKAAYEDGRSEAISGREAYMRYAEKMTAIVEAAGGRVRFMADVTGVVIGELEEPWDAVALVEYPSSAAFVAIATSPEVMEIGTHRAAGLAGQLLIRSKVG
jgi:uncharacterized protein (DUF1330 family)